MAGRSSPRAAAAWLLASLVAGCAVETTYEDVYPILASRCNGCHVDGVSTYRPYFTDYASVASLGQILRDAVTNRAMPPFGMDNTAACGNNYFADEGLWLSDLELQTITDWVDGGLVEGDPGNLHAGPGYVERALEHVDRTIDMGQPYAFAGFDPDSQHRCFVTDPAIDGPALLSAFEVRPGNEFSVQTVALYALDDAEAQAEAEARDAEDPAPGYPCFSGAGVDGARFAGTWVWGRKVVRFPAGTGVALRPGSKLVVQVHYNAQGGSVHPAEDWTRVDLELADAATEASFMALSAEGFSLRPGLDDAVARGFMTIDRPFTILGVAPLMHQSGVSLALTRVRPFSETCLAKVDHWQFYNHLRLYQYLSPPPELLPGDRLDIECTYQTQSRIEPTRQGQDASSEECAARLYIVRGDT